jgi:hypothetical protein
VQVQWLRSRARPRRHVFVLESVHSLVAMSSHDGAVDVEYSGRTHRAYMTFGHERPRLYIGIYKSRDTAHTAAAAVQLAGCSDEAARAAQKTAWDAMEPGYVPLWRSTQGKDGRRHLYVLWNTSHKTGDKIFLGSFRTEIAARSALDAFLTFADKNLEDAVAKAKQIAIEERFTTEEGSNESGITVTACPGPCSNLTPFCPGLWISVRRCVLLLSFHRLSQRYRGSPAGLWR